MSKRKYQASQEEVPDTIPNTVANTPTPKIYTSTPIHDRNSKFQAIFTVSPTDPKSLQLHPPFTSADHKILAWRRPSSQKSISSSFTSSSSSTSKQNDTKSVICETGSDEDGEKYAGKKLEKVLVEMGVEEGAVVVARWWGGVMLGPVRFKWIEDCAREAILLWTKDGEDGVEKKKVKVDASVEVGQAHDDDSRKQRERLVIVLKDRDESVAVLRGLLAEKNELSKTGGKVKTSGDAGGGQNGVVKSPTSGAPDYSSMSLDRLKQLEKARDATLGWILKQIDTVEEKLRAAEKEKNG